MSQPHDDSTLEALEDDWGDFSSVISTLEAQETDTESNALNEANETAENSGPSQEALSGLLHVFLMISEKATSVVTGVPFEFEEADKIEVINAAIPVLNKNGGAVAGWLGDYVEEATLALAVLGMLYTARQSINIKKAEKLKQEQKQKKVEVTQHEEKANPTPAS
ncbi:hypothetical protein [Vibrio atlanticus]|uniref:hypothetical protein n=1 Tax=Vibrio atlanticus TaxID=693153 RepID=UPI00355285AB